jgi:hypothetical protein
MKYVKSVAVSSALFWLVGCASAQKVTVLEPVGPAPTGIATAQGEGMLQVYTARKSTPINLNGEEFFWNNDYGRNDFLHYPAHTDYTILAQDGKVVRQVHNATDLYDAQPAQVSLAPGFYTVQAQAEDFGRVRQSVLVPVEVKAGQTTAVHLAGDWKVSARCKNQNLVRMSNGTVAGWRVPPAEYMHAGAN